MRMKVSPDYTPCGLDLKSPENYLRENHYISTPYKTKKIRYYLKFKTYFVQELGGQYSQKPLNY